MIEKNSITGDIIRKAKLIHKKKYDYSKVNYLGANKPITVICKSHGEFGISDDTDTPHLASQNSAYAIKQLKDYKSKLRVDKNMYKRAKRLDDERMSDLAA